MGAKNFINQTGYDLSVTLTVRAGSDPGTASDVRDFTLVNSQPPFFYQYSGDDNPYLDGILVYATDVNDIAGKLYVFTRGDDPDNALNTNNTVTFSMQDGVIELTCTNS